VLYRYQQSSQIQGRATGSERSDWAGGYIEELARGGPEKAIEKGKVNIPSNSNAFWIVKE